MKILVTGSSGFIGSFLVKKLKKLGHDVSGFNTSNGDIVDVDVVREAVRGHDAVFHLAGISRLSEVEKNPMRSHEVNVTGTTNVVMACRLFQAKLIFTSSELVYGNNVIPFTEELYPFPLGEYGCQKILAESMCFPLTDFIARLGAVYGPSPLCHSVFNRFIQFVKAGKWVPMYPVEMGRDFVFVDDVVDALVFGLNENNVGVFNVGTGVETSFSDLLELISKELDVKYEVINKNERLPYVVEHTCLEWSKMKCLGWIPKVDVKEGIRRCKDV